MIVVFSGSDSFSRIWSQGEREREREREGRGGGEGWTKLSAGVNFAFSSMRNDMHAEERQARFERELKCKSEESDRAHRSVPTSCLYPLESKLGFSHMSIFSQSAERAAQAAPNGIKKWATFLVVFRCLNLTASPLKAFDGVQKGQVHSKKHKPSKKYFCWRSTLGSPPAGLKVSHFFGRKRSFMVEGKDVKARSFLFLSFNQLIKNRNITTVITDLDIAVRLQWSRPHTCRYSFQWCLYKLRCYDTREFLPHTHRHL